jgi:hypothetical protein
VAHKLQIETIPNRKNSVIGRKSGSLTVIGTIHGDPGKCLVSCKCGTVKTIHRTNLKKFRSCGCQRIKLLKAAATTHGQSRTPEYRAFQAIHQRCENPKCHKYPLYGGRGIKVSKRWSGEHGFENFLKDAGKRPSPKHSLDRWPNNATGHYNPGNVRWATIQQQRINQRRVQLKNAA